MGSFLTQCLPDKLPSTNIRQSAIHGALLSALLTVLAACGGSGSSETNTASAVTSTNVTSPAQGSSSPTAPAPDSTTKADIQGIERFQTPASTSRFLGQATFGATHQQVEALTGTASSDWVMKQFDMPTQYTLPMLLTYRQHFGLPEYIEDINYLNGQMTGFAFWKNAIAGNDQLRQRMAFALSQIVVVSHTGAEYLSEYPELMAYYMDLLAKHAFGNYGDLLLDITYSPAMGMYLTYQGNKKGNPETGSVPDENYAREILQLFSVGLVALNMDGTPKLNEQGNPIELYDNQDITGLARVFTGLDFAYGDEHDEVDGETFYPELAPIPMALNPDLHSRKEKTFLGLTIPANTDGVTSIQMAIDHIMAQPSVAPFIARQLIQRFTTSHPEPDYIERVATAFETGLYTLPNDVQVGEGRKGDLKATLAAILFDPDATSDINPHSQVDTKRFAKVREPVLRFTNWARAFALENVTPELIPLLWNTESTDTLNQQAHHSHSVFNFFRPGYVPPATQSGEEGLTVPELQIVTASSIPGYINFMEGFIFAAVQEDPEVLSEEEKVEAIDEGDVEVRYDFSGSERSFLPNYDFERTLANDPEKLVRHLSLLLSANALSESTQQHIASTIALIEISEIDTDNTAGNDDSESLEMEDDPLYRRVMLAVFMIMTSPDYLVQR
ncbi:DUF1800 domain-containing protein [Aestuariibacter sp. AA17]|uniref:DUF1800 domain-containing protein n=1 Tax=Fluctibacter corallii TaxID=2984329 RepID=A0ABT3AAJ5_9ALTE|nr:DUF1800 domain-containing protein [Aestuariibacter sp. AA17]MCV2885678.1 DUF1800 domain-containing protein [Aestuariibacter sp. AA17]